MARSKAELVEDLCARIRVAERSHDELRVLAWVLEGLELGARSYGPLNLADDSRNWDREIAMECRDLLAYSAMLRIAKADRERERVERECENAFQELRDVVVETARWNEWDTTLTPRKPYDDEER